MKNIKYKYLIFNNKIFILYTSQSELIYKHNTIREISEKVNPPRSLFIKYDVTVKRRSRGGSGQ